MRPSKCDICDADLKDAYIDGRTRRGPWANMCPSCFFISPGIGKLGIGLGTKFVRKKDEWVKAPLPKKTIRGIVS